ncbi:MAG: NAD(+)/NADH kinase [Candidatus Bathyarchaeota archaeon]|nr:MAG: NAD(+)/NADH kinase [Candidatus Bathyarchaeota archaeon]
MFKSVGLVARYDRKQAIKLAEEMAEYLKTKGLEVYMEDTLTGKMNTQGKLVPLASMKTDFIITIGGDGTILRTCIAVPKPEPLILAINMGVRGFLTEVEPKDAFAAVEKCLNGEYKIEKCSKLAVSTGGEIPPDALNDVVISAGEPSKILYTQIFKDEKPILKCQADGLIVSTQTGSTGYSLSAGGPVLDKEVDAFVLTPICSLTVFRSIVFPADANVTIKAIRPKKMLVLIDGNYRFVTGKATALTVTRSKNVTSFIRFKDNFYNRLRSRLLFKGTG